MASSALLLVALKTLFSILACVMVAALAYGLVMDGFYSCLDPHARWMQVALIGLKWERVVFLTFEFTGLIHSCLLAIVRLGSSTRNQDGSATICGYIVLLLFKLSPEESLKVLAKHEKR
ncbi:G-type lectin S-receptor-like serine/threonine-protein kinase [Tanacetum coccineum]